MNVAVTGASGFIGSHLVPALEEDGWSITAVTEPGNEVTCDNARVIPSDVVSGKGLSDAFAGADAVVHLAARNHLLRETSPDPLREFRKVNVVGTRNVILAAKEAGVGKFVHISSVKAMGEESAEVLDEDAPCLPSTPYGISKLESEEAVREEAERSRIQATILRLPMVYGQRNKGNLPRMIRWADKGLPFPLFRPDNLRSMVYVGNVVDGILEVLKNASSGGSIYLLKDKKDYSTRTVYSTICQELGKKPRFLPVPAGVVRIGGMLFKDVRKITGTFRVSSAKIEKEIGFSPSISLEEGIARTIRWYRSAH